MQRNLLRFDSPAVSSNSEQQLIVVFSHSLKTYTPHSTGPTMPIRADFLFFSQPDAPALDHCSYCTVQFSYFIVLRSTDALPTMTSTVQSADGEFLSTVS